MKTAIMFSGQGSQYTLMGIDVISLSKNKEKIKLAEKILNFNINEVLKNENNELSQTKYVQPLMVLVSILLFEEYNNKFNLDGMLGFSLGEYSALYASGIYDFETIIKLVKYRSTLMEDAANKYPGKMVAVLNFELNKLKEVVKSINDDKNKILTIANYNSKKQFVLSGNEEGINEAINKLKELNVRRIIPLNVSGGFHSKLMYESSLKLNTYLKTLNKNENKYDLYLNTTAQPLNINELEDELTKQMYMSVYFYQSIENMINNGYKRFIEIGPGKVLSNLVKRNYKDVDVYNIEKMEDLNNLEDK